ncbi:hypothetical protein ACJW31_03G121900 [Castanea mollissima]
MALSDGLDHLTSLNLGIAKEDSGTALMYFFSFYFLSAIKISGCSSQLSQKEPNSLISKIHSRVSDPNTRKACRSMSEGIIVESGDNNRSMNNNRMGNRKLYHSPALHQSNAYVCKATIELEV